MLATELVASMPTQKNEHEVKCSVLLMMKHHMFQVIDTRSAVKKIRLNSLSASTDLQALAQDVVDKCKLISQSNISKVSKCVRYRKKNCHDFEENQCA